MPTTDEAEIRDVIAAQLAALHDRDPERMHATYSPDVVQYTLAPPLQHLGFDVEAVRAWMTGFDGPIEREPKDLEVTVGGDVAFVHGLTALRATPAGAPEGSSCGRAPPSASAGSTAAGASRTTTSRRRSTWRWPKTARSAPRPTCALIGTPTAAGPPPSGPAAVDAASTRTSGPCSSRTAG